MVVLVLVVTVGVAVELVLVVMSALLVGEALPCGWACTWICGCTST